MIAYRESNIGYRLTLLHTPDTEYDQQISAGITAIFALDAVVVRVSRLFIVGFLKCICVL